MKNNKSASSTLLSICIPTYNRGRYLYENLSSIMPQINNHKDDGIEILINDNNSDTESKEFILSKINEHKWNVNYQYNSTNIGFEKNVANLIERSHGKYIYLLGDDDIVSPNFLDSIIPFIIIQKYGIIHFNRLIGNEFCSNNTLHDTFFSKMTEVLTFDNFIKRVMSSPNFMSSSIFKKEIWTKSETLNINSYYGYGFLGRIYNGALNTINLYFYMPLIIMRNPPRVWCDYNFLYMQIGMYNIFEDLDKSIHGLKQKWIERVRESHFYDFHRDLALIGDNQLLYKEHQTEIYKVCESRIERIIATFFLYTPCPRLMKGLYQKCLTLIRLFSKTISFTRITKY